MAGLIPRSFIDELLSRTDLVELVDAYVPLKKQGTSHTACCPFHHEKTPSFNVISKKQFYHCFGCGASGNAISFAMNYLRLSFSDAVEMLAARLGLQVPREGRLDKNQPTQTLYQFLSSVATFYQKTLKTEGQAAIAYLKQRDISGEVARLYQLGYAPVGWHNLEPQFRSYKQELIATGMVITKEDEKTYDRYRQRIMFPIHDRHGRIIGFGGRAIEDSQKPKYLNSPETVIFQKNRELYGLHQVLQHTTPLNHILVVEGYMDVIALTQHGIINAVATLGTATSTYHIQLLSKHTNTVIFCFDGDTAGKQAAWRALESTLPHLNTGLDANFVFLPEGHDPDSLVRLEGKAAFLARLEQATPFNRFLFDTLSQPLDTTSLAGKSQLIHAAKPYLQKMPDGPYKQLLMDELARMTRLETHRIQALIDETTKTILPDTNNAITRSPARVAIAILLQHPELITAKPLSLSPLLSQKHKLLNALIKQVKETPTINTAHLVEAWRNTRLFEALVKLAAWDHQVPEHALTREFMDIILFLEKQTREHTITQFMQKAQQEGLLEAERLQLQALLKQRHRPLEKEV